MPSIGIKPTSLQLLGLALNNTFKEIALKRGHSRNLELNCIDFKNTKVTSHEFQEH